MNSSLIFSENPRQTLPEIGSACGDYRIIFHSPPCVSVLIVCCVIFDPTALLQPHTTTTERLRFAYALQSASDPANHTVACVSYVPSASTTAASAASAVVIVLAPC
jgi:hypothetical protein